MKKLCSFLFSICFLHSASAITVNVPGAACPWLAGAQAGTTAFGGYDSVATEGPTLVQVQGGQVLSFSATGATNYAGGTPTTGPDGIDGYDINQSALNGISGSAAIPVSSLVGVFLTDAVPANGDEAGYLDFSTFHKNYLTLSPALNQIFFIGDGRTSTNDVQQVTVPAGATRLFLGTVDGAGWYNNTGTISVTITGVSPPTLQFSATGPASDGAPIHFTATTDTGWAVRVQFTNVASPAEADWTDLNDGNGGAMTESPAGSGQFVLDSTAYPSGSGISFRAIATQTGESDIKSAALGPYTLHQAVLSIAASLTSTSDFAHGYTAYIDDYLIYRLTFKNSGDAKAKSLRVMAKVPTFRYADLPVLVKTTAGSSTVTMASGDTSQLAVGGTFAIGPGLGGSVVGPSGFISLSATITGITDATHFTISSAATKSSGTQTVSLLVQYASASKQFKASDISLSPGGTYVPETSPGANDAKLVWDVGDLPGAAGLVYSQYVTFTAHLTGKVATQQDLSILNDYFVTSTASPPQPSLSASGYSSQSPNPRCRVNDSISFTLNPLATKVTPGGLMTYVFALTNRGSAAAASPVAVIEVPLNTRYAATYANGTKGVVGVGTSPTSKLVYHTGNPSPQLVLKFPALAAKATVQVKVTFQAKWADPNDVTKISTIDYGAAFLDATQPKPISAASAFTTLFNAASSDPTKSGTTDFYALISDPVNKLARSRNQSGVVNVTFSGSTDSAPRLGALKVLSNVLAKTENNGDDSLTDLVKPGDKITFILTVVNTGSSPADEVFVTEEMPEHCSYVAKSGALFGPATKSKTKSTLTVTPDVDGHHLLFTGMHLEPKDTVSFVYTAQVSSSLTVPAPTDPPLLLGLGNFSTGSGSTTSTPVGLSASQQIKVIGNVLFAQPRVSVMIPNPTVSANVTTTSATLDTLYAKTPSALPLTNSKDFLSYIDGVERYYIHYENAGNAGASGVKLVFPLPANTAFYRASWVTLSGGNMPGTIAAKPAGGSISAPAKLATSGNVTFMLNTLAAGGKGDVMVETIVLPGAVQTAGSHIGDNTRTVSISDSTVVTPPPAPPGSTPPPPSILSFHESQLPIKLLPVKQLASVPQVGLERHITTGNVAANGTFSITYVAFNYGDIGCTPILSFTVPANSKLLSITQSTTTIPDPGNEVAGTEYGINVITSNNSPTYQAGNALQPHSAGAITFTLQAIGAVGTNIVENQSIVRVDNHDPLVPDAAVIHIVAPSSLPQLDQSSPTQVLGRSFTTLSNGVLLIDIGAGNIVAQGAGNIVAQGGGNIIAQGAGNLIGQDGASFIATGAGSLMGLTPPNGGSFTAISSLLANNASLVTTSKWGNHVVQNAAELILPTAGNIVAQGGGNIVAQGGGNIVAQGGGNIVAQGGGNIVAQGGGNIVAQGAGNIVAAGGGNIVAQGAGNIVAQGAGNIVAQGAGNIVAQGAGN